MITNVFVQTSIMSKSSIQIDDQGLYEEKCGCERGGGGGVQIVHVLDQSAWPRWERMWTGDKPALVKGGGGDF